MWDEGMISSDPVGFSKVKVSSLMLNNGTDDHYEVSYNNKPAGTIHLISTFAPFGGDQYENMKAAFQEQERKLQQEADDAKAALSQLTLK